MSIKETSVDNFFPDWLHEDIIEENLNILRNHENSALIRIGVLGYGFDLVKNVLDGFSSKHLQHIKDDKSEIFLFLPNYTSNESVNVMLQVHFMKEINNEFVHWTDIAFFIFDITNQESFNYVVKTKKHCDFIKRHEKSVLLGVMDGMKNMNDRINTYQSLLIQSIRMGFDHYVDIINNEGKYEWFESLVNLNAAKFISSFVAQKKTHRNILMESIDQSVADNSKDLFPKLENTNICRKLSTNRERVNQLDLKLKLLDDYNKNCCRYLYFNTTNNCKCDENQNLENSRELNLDDADIMLKYDVKIQHGILKKTGEIILTKCGYIYLKSKDRIIRQLVMFVSSKCSSHPNISKRRGSIFLTDSQDHKLTFDFKDDLRNVIVYFQSETDKNRVKMAIEPASFRCYNDHNSMTIEQKDFQQALLDRLLEVPGNGNCADCKLRYEQQRPPTWHLTLYGLLVCTDCAGIHRSLTLDVSRVKSLLIDNFPPVKSSILQTGFGNIVGNSVFEFIDAPFSNLCPPGKLTQEFFDDKYSKLKYLSSRSRKISRRRFTEAILLDHPFHLLTQVFSASRLINEYARYDGSIPWALVPSENQEFDWTMSEITMFQLAVHCGSVNAVFVLFNHNVDYLKRDGKGRLFTYYIPSSPKRSIRHIMIIEFLIEIGVLKKKAGGLHDVYRVKGAENEEGFAYTRCMKLEDLLDKYQNCIVNSNDKSTFKRDNSICDLPGEPIPSKVYRLMSNAN